MEFTLILFVATVFTLLSALHIYWALGGTRFGPDAVPHSETGAAVFQPGKAATLIVAAGLFLFALIVAGNTGVFGQIVPVRLLRICTWIIAGIFALRTLGDFRYVGLFKRIRSTDFARKDTRIYTPLCAAIAVSCFAIGLDF
jgi:hypothetical protein